MPKATFTIPGETSRSHTKLNSAYIAIPENCVQTDGRCFMQLTGGGGYTATITLPIHQHGSTSKKNDQAGQALSI